jgi:stearoyl-CoA desaturase (delta-9 desaturase)
MFTHAIPAPARWVPELLKNPTVAWLSRTYVAWFVAGQLAPALVVGVVTGSGWGALSGLLWAGLVRTILVQHVIWSINSVCHIIGTRPYPSRDYSRNVGWLALVSCGESWHNNHHAQPTSAVHGFDRGQVDLSGLVLRGLARIGLIEGLRLPNERTLLRLRGDRAVQLGDTAGARRAWEQARALAVQEDAQGIVADIDRAIAGLGR